MLNFSQNVVLEIYLHLPSMILWTSCISCENRTLQIFSAYNIFINSQEPGRLVLSSICPPVAWNTAPEVDSNTY